jgi:hypothetical protein
MLRGHRYPVLFSLALVASSACGAAPPPPVLPLPAPAPARLSKELERSLAALSLPKELVLAGRWKHPNQLLGKLEAWSRADLPLDAWLRQKLGDPSRSFDLDAPIELIAVLDQTKAVPSLEWALSVGLAVPEGASGPSQPKDVESPVGLACAESKALGSAAARLVCAASDDQLARLLPHATRALPLAPVGDADVALSLRAAPLAELDPAHLHELASSLLAQWLGIGGHINERFDTQWAKVVEGFAGELRDLAADLDGASLELALAPHDEGLDVSILAPAAAGHSTLGQLLVGSGASGLAPAEFWRAHQASDAAGFVWAWQAAPLARLREPVAALLGTVLDYRGVPNRLEQQARELVSYLPMPRGPVIHASGRLPPVTHARDARAPWLEELGWQLYDVRGNFDEYQYYVGALARSFNDPILGAQFARLIRGTFGPKWAPTRLLQRRPASGELPRNSFVLQVSLPAQDPPASLQGEPGGVPADVGRAAPEWFVIFVPDEDGVRIAAGADERFLSSLLTQPARAKASTTLAGRPGLGSLHEHRILAGGFFSLAGGFFSLTGREDTQPGSLTGLSAWAGRAQPVDRAPHRGASPIVYALSQPSEAWLHLTTHVGRETLEDLLFAIGAVPRDATARDTAPDIDERAAPAQ